MISDTLSQAISEIDEYLDLPAFEGVYTGDLRRRIETLRSDMEDMRRELDGVPAFDQNQK